MQVQIRDLIYHVYFRHHPPAPPNRREITQCLIEFDHALVASGAAHRHHRDPPNREVGRKAALTNTLACTLFDKAARAAFWSAYLNRKAPKVIHALAKHL